MPETPAKSLSLEEASEITSNLVNKIGESIFGQQQLVTEAVCCLLAGGHILMTGAPGLAKTSLVRVIASHIGLPFGRIQFTPDLLPSDIIGSDILNIDPVTQKRLFEFSKGPIFTGLLLADEINRASPRTQSALLEAMQEGTCTVGGILHELEQPFMVFATQNPFESEGTFPLPEAQLDRFLMHVLVDYPSLDSEKQILKEHVNNRLVGEQKRGGIFPQSDKPAPLGADVTRSLIQKTKSIAIDDELVEVISELVRSTRLEDENCPKKLRDHIWYGAGPRGGISLISVSKALALISQSEVVRWRHIRQMAKPVLRHRIRLTSHATRDQIFEDHIIDELLERLEDRHRFLVKGTK